MKKSSGIWVFAWVSFSIAMSCSSDGNEERIMPSTVTDVDGNVYNTVLIGTQLWMAENLQTTKYRNGDLIGTTNPATADLSQSPPEDWPPMYQWPVGGDESNVATYGRQYTWYVATDNRKLCPTGWHVPTYNEFQKLITFLGGDLVAGGKLKEAGLAHWADPNEGATNESGFSGLPGSSRHYTGIFGVLGNVGNWWGSSAGNGNNYEAISFTVSYEYSTAGTLLVDRTQGMCVRCLMD